MNLKTRMFCSLALVALLWGCGPAGDNPISTIEQSATSGYGMYRSGQPVEAQLVAWCKAGGGAVFALNGRGSQYEQILKKNCPNTTIVYNTEQDPDTGIDEAFLQKFDAEVAKAKAGGYKILFHCNCGCHRTGRLAAYYRIKYNGYTAEQAIKEMNDIGKDMDQHPTLIAQVRAYEDYVNGRTCSQKAKYCVQENI